MENTKISKGTIIRFVLVVVAVLNTALTVTGHNPLPFDEAWIENTITIGFDAVVTWLAYWKNNSHTQKAMAADEVLAALKEGIITIEDVLKTLETKKGE